MIRILHIADKLYVYSAGPVQVPIWKGRMYRVFDIEDADKAVAFRNSVQHF